MLSFECACRYFPALLFFPLSTCLFYFSFAYQDNIYLHKRICRILYKKGLHHYPTTVTLLTRNAGAIVAEEKSHGKEDDNEICGSKYANKPFIMKGNNTKSLLKMSDRGTQ